VSCCVMVLFLSCRVVCCSCCVFVCVTCFSFHTPSTPFCFQNPGSTVCVYVCMYIYAGMHVYKVVYMYACICTYLPIHPVNVAFT